MRVKSVRGDEADSCRFAVTCDATGVQWVRRAASEAEARAWRLALGDEGAGRGRRFFAHTFLTAEGEWTDARFRWGRGLAKLGSESGRLRLESLPAEVAWDGRLPDAGGGGRWCFCTPPPARSPQFVCRGLS